MGNQFLDVEVQSYVDHRITEATLQQPEAYYATMALHWAKAHGGHAIRPQVGEATTPHPYKPLES